MINNKKIRDIHSLKTEIVYTGEISPNTKHCAPKNSYMNNIKESQGWTYNHPQNI